MFKNQISRLRSRQEGFNDAITIAIIGGIIGAIFIAGVFVWQEVEKASYFNILYNGKKVEKAVKQPDYNKDNSKINYGSDASKKDKYREDCESRGGKFNSCDSACAPGTVCIEVCIFSCDISSD